MRLRGRRVAFLLASALPLLAGDLNSEEPQKNKIVDEDENDFVPLTASEAIHHDNFRLPSLQNVDVVSEEEEAGVVEVTAEDSKHAEGVDSHTSGEVTDTESSSDDSQQEEDKTSVESTEEVSSSTQETVDPVNETSSDGDETESDAAAVEEDKVTAPQDADPADYTEKAASSDESSIAENEEIETSKEGHEEGKNSPEENGEEDEENVADRVSVDYASKSAGAQIIEKSSSFKGTSNLLNADKDKYAISPCEERKFVVVSLSEDILVKTINLANYERFSSSVKDFQVMGSQTLGKWVDLGTYTAKAGNGEQLFELREPAWGRYLKFKFLSHHGEEYYCTYSQIKVHGSTMVQGFHEQWEDSEEEDAENLRDVEGSATELMDSEQSREGSKADGTDSKSSAEGQGEGEQVEAARADGTHDEVPNTGTDDDNTDQNSKEADPMAETTLHDSINTFPGIGKFYTSTALDEMLHGEIDDDGDLLSELLELIPTTLSTLSITSRESPGRRNSDTDLSTLHQLGTLPVQSIYSSSRMAADAANAMVAESSGTIVAPKMTDKVEEMTDKVEEMTKKVEEMARQYLGRDLPTKVLPSRKNQEGHCEGNVSENGRSCDETPDDADSNRTDYQESDNQRVKNDKVAESQADETAAKKPTSQDETASGSQESTSTANAQESVTPEAKRDQNEGATSMESVHHDVMDLTLAKMLENLPSAECLSKLDFAEFKTRMTASRKSAGGTGASHSAGTIEPIFKKLTDEIKSLQTSLSVQDQFTKTSVSCYQRVLLDVIIEMERMRTDQGDRIARLEEQFQNSWSSILLKVWRGFLHVVPSTFLKLWRWFLHVVSSTVLKLWRWFLHAVSAIFLWTYSFVSVIYSWTYFWISTLVGYSLRLPGIALRFALPLWPRLKSALLSTETGSELAVRLSPIILHIDQLVERLDSDYLKEDFGPTTESSDHGTLTIPVLPTIFVLFFCRLIMFCTAMGTKRVDAKQEKFKITQKENTPNTPKHEEEQLPPLIDAETHSPSASSP